MKQYENGDVIKLSNIDVTDYFDYWFTNYVEENSNTTPKELPEHYW